MNKESIKYFAPVLIVSAVLIGLIGMNFYTPTAAVTGVTGSGITYHSMVCKKVTRADGTVENLGCDHNVLADAGKNITRDALNGISQTVNGLALGNGSAPTATSYGNLISGCGLGITTATYQANTTAHGAWGRTYTFTSTCNNIVVNSTVLFNSTTAAAQNYFAGNTFTSTTLQAQDQITVTWVIWVE